MDEWLFISLVIYGTVTFLCVAGVIGVCIKKAPKDDGTPREFAAHAAMCLACPLWPLVLALGIVIGIPAAIIDKFLCTPGYTCCGMSCAKGPKPAAAAPPATRSNEHNMEAAAVVSVPPPAAPVEAMEMRPTC